MPKPGWDVLLSARPEAAEAVAFFRSRMGDGVVRKGHPFATTFVTCFQNGPSEGERLYKIVRSLDGVPGRDDLVRDLGKRQIEDYRSGEMTLRLAAGWRSAGCEVEFIPRRDAKTPDLKVRFNDRWSFVECVCVNENSENSDSHAFVQFAMNWAERVQGHLSGRFLPDSTVDDLAWVRDQLAEFEHVSTIQHRQLPGRVELHFEPGAERNYFPFDNLPSTRSNDLSRVLDKIGKKQRQLPEGDLGLIVIDVGDLFDVGDPELVRLAIRKRLAQFPRVSAVLVMQTDFQAHEGRAGARGFFVGATDQGFLRRGVIVSNPNATKKFTRAELERLLAVAFK